MVNVAKRMRILDPKLFRIRHGQGAATLPLPPSPQLSLLNLRYNRRLWNKATKPARTFHQEHLPRLKYHNPALPINIVGAAYGRLQLTFESPDQGALEAMGATSDEFNLRGNEFREKWSPVEAKPQPAANASDTSSTSPPTSIFRRNVTLDLSFKETEQIWKWFQQTTKCEDVPETPEETARMQELEAFAEKAEEDRQRVKAGRDALRKQQAELKRAREAAEKMANEV